jgi:aspartyl-tRNA(Asn)/glutamyl-tRNA(Gln) amidotransferase subunit B
LLPLELTQEYVDNIKATLPELPDARKDRYMNNFDLSSYDAGVLVAERDTAQYFEKLAKGHDPKLAANWVISNLFAVLKEKGVGIAESPVSAESLSKLLDLLKDETISSRIAKDVFEIMVNKGKEADVIVEEKGLKQITDTGAIEAAIDEVILKSPEQVSQYKSGNEKIAGWFVGQVMKETQGKANPAIVNQLLRDKLK